MKFFRSRPELIAPLTLMFGIFAIGLLTGSRQRPASSVMLHEDTVGGRFFVNSAGVFRPLTEGGGIIDEAVGSINPSVLAYRADTDTGLCTNNADQIILCAGGTAIVDCQQNDASDETCEINAELTNNQTDDIGWSIQTSANQACNTTCTHGCVMGHDTGTGSWVNCSDATADECLCAGET